MDTLATTRIVTAPSSINNRCILCHIDVAPSFVAYRRLNSKNRWSLVASSPAVKKRKNGLSEEGSTSSSGNLTRLDAAATSDSRQAKSVQQRLVCQSEERTRRWCNHICQCQETDQDVSQEEGNEDFEGTWGVKLALAALSFYRREISPFLPSSCRYVPSCSQYSIQAYKKYGVLKGTILTAWRIARCNPFGGSGFDPPRWFGET